MVQERKNDGRLVALFANEQEAEEACRVLVKVGIPAAQVEMQTGAPEHTPVAAKSRLVSSVQGGTLAGIGFGAIVALLIYIGAVQNVFANPVISPWIMGLSGSLIGAMVGALIGLANGVNIPRQQGMADDSPFRRYYVTADGTDEEIEQALIFLRQQGFQV
jgi:hypothetical protein